MPAHLSVISMRYRITLLIFLLIGFGSAHAECSRSDINYYLSKGFTHEQITALCGSAKSESRRDYQAYEDRSEAEERTRSKTRKKEDDILTLRTSINAWDIDITPTRLAYTRKFCIAAGQTAEVEGRTRICPEVRYHIYFKNLKIVGQKRKYFFIGQREIQVIGKVKRKLLHDLKNYPEDLRQQLLNSYKSRVNKKGTFIPIRRDTPITQVASILQEYAYVDKSVTRNPSPKKQGK